ncbi:MAG: DUF2490 domain-containing protein [Bacteroidia bacterium]|nr:DUF2490 domain-containing protein [Bacteroidia bacterium]
MTHKKNSPLALLAVLAVSLFIAPTSLRADDAGSWISLQLNKGWQSSYAFLRLEHRSNQKFGSTEATFLATGAGYKFCPWLKTDLSYEYWNVNPEITMHKAVLTTTGTLQRDGLAVSVREKLEYAINPATSAKSYTLRSRLRAQYSIPETNVTPYAMAEVFNWKAWVRSLYYAGAEFKFGDHSVVDLFYLYHLPNGNEPVNVLGLGYYFNF